jgi:hypothetical protein
MPGARMPDDGAPLPLRVVDADALDGERRAVLRPAARLEDRAGRARELPRWFYEVESWDQAREVGLAPNFMLWEFITVDVREAPSQRAFPRYVPCAIALLAAHLQALRDAIGTYVHIAANGGYRSPAHALSTHASTHCWGTAANIYRIGDDYLDTEDRIRRYTRVVRQVLPHAWVRPYGSQLGESDDHLHVDIGYAIACPHSTGDPDSSD